MAHFFINLYQCQYYIENFDLRFRTKTQGTLLGTNKGKFTSVSMTHVKNRRS